MIVEYLTQFGTADRATVNQLLESKLSNDLDIMQKDRKIANLLTKLRRNNLIKNIGTTRKSLWVLIK
ncbi:hypothetical protein Mh1960_17740 [Mannheimia haemolytica]